MFRDKIREILELVLKAEEQGKTLLEAYPDSEMADEYRKLAKEILKVCQEEKEC